MMHKFFFVGSVLMMIITVVSTLAYIDNFQMYNTYGHIQTVAGIFLNALWCGMFLYMYNQNKPHKANVTELNEMIKEFNSTPLKKVKK